MCDAGRQRERAKQRNGVLVPETGSKEKERRHSFPFPMRLMKK
jgi:hypothetical protein